VSTGGSTSDLLQGSSFTQNRVKSYTDLVTRPRVLLPVIQQLGLGHHAGEIGQVDHCRLPVDTVLINITATDTDPQMASDVANATASSLGKEVTALEKPAGTQPCRRRRPRRGSNSTSRSVSWLVWRSECSWQSCATCLTQRCDQRPCPEGDRRVRDRQHRLMTTTQPCTR
jgi:hypothetical protein